MVVYETISKSPHETRDVGREFAKSVKKGEVIFLEGSLGAGKTEFVRGFAFYHGIKSIRSPSFTVVFEHISKYGFPIYHIDLYRFEQSFIELLERGIIDIFEKKDGIVLIEWADRIENFYTPNYIVKIKHLSENERKITIERVI